MKAATVAVVVSTVLVFVTAVGWSQQPDKEHAELAKALDDAKIPLQRGLTASAKEGKPISAKYEVEDGKLQLSVYTMKGDKFSEVIVDHKTGKVSKTEPITQGDDLTHAKAQSEAMAKANRSLDAGVTHWVVPSAPARSRREPRFLRVLRDYGLGAFSLKSKMGGLEGARRFKVLKPRP